MTTETGSPAGQESAALELPADAPESFSSVNEAAAYFTQLQEKRKEQPAESAETATAETELADEANAAPETDPGEEPEAIEPENLPPIEPPRSWTKEEKEAFAKLPRDMQEINSRIASARETEFRRGQNELAEQRKAVQAEREAAEKVRQQYEAKLPSLLNELESVNQAQFGDIKSMEDVVKLQNEDPFRFQAWQVHQMRLQAAKAEEDRLSSERSATEQSNWAKHIQEENAKAAEFITELADKEKGQALVNRVATELLPDLGFKDSELAELASGKTKLSIYDHRIQRLLADSLKLKDILNAPKAVAKPNLPPVQKPGISKPAGSDVSERIQALNRKTELSVKEATELYQLQSRPRRAS